MLINQTNSQELEQLIAQHEIMFIDFWASWCAPCKQFAPVYEKIAGQYPDIAFAKINIEQESELAEVFQIRSIPHLMVFKQGIVIYSEAGSMPASVLTDLVEQSIKADVSEIKEKLNNEDI